MLSSHLLFSQVNNDSIFSAAIEHSRNKNYTEALAQANKVLVSDSMRVDVLVFSANVYAWQHKYDKAKTFITRAYTIAKTNEELYDSWLNILLWNNEPEALKKTCLIAESHNYKNKYNMFVKRLLVYQMVKDYKGIKAVIEDRKNQEYIDSAQVIQLYEEAVLLSKDNFLSANYSLDFFDNNQPQHLASLDYSFKTGEDRIIFRVNWAHRYGSNGIQLESDFYKMLKKRKYMYFNYGYSIDNIIFPKHRAGYEFYFPLKNSFEASLGARYLRFPNRNVFITTGHLSKYFGKNWIAFRPFYVIQELGNTFSFSADYRRYSDLPLNYWGIGFGYGNSPDDRFSLTQSNQFFKLNSYKIKLEKNFILFRTNEIKIGAAYNNEEYLSGSFRNRYTIELAYKFRM